MQLLLVYNLIVSEGRVPGTNKQVMLTWVVSAPGPKSSVTCDVGGLRGTIVICQAHNHGLHPTNPLFSPKISPAFPLNTCS